MKFGILTLAFYGNATLDRMLANTGAYVDKIYLSHSPVPWSKYNWNAREIFSSDFDRSKIPGFPYSEKIQFIEGVWESEESQRDQALQQARADGIDYLIIQDADEFYLPEDFLKNLQGIRNNPDYPAYLCPWVKFWKTTEFVMLSRKHLGVPKQTVTTCPNFAVNVNYPGIHFNSNRLVNGMDKAFMLDGLCLHLCWVLTNEEVLKKIITWGHSHQFDYKKWYKHKWLAWNKNTEYIGLFKRSDYLSAVPFHGMLPKELNGFGLPEQEFKPLTVLEKLDCWVLDLKAMVQVWLLENKKRVCRKKEGF